MKTRKEAGRDREREFARSAIGEEALEFVFNDEEDALSSEELALTHQRDMPALQEFLREMSELDSRNPCPFVH
ncbi:MAG TPA: hypothetical protein VD839_05390 [Burkholderiales bacterium]|jgi:hypothetical protein|nr:hypothetical protein [Burkholderiales bacterium]